MSNFTLTVPDDMVQAAQQIAEATSQPLEQVLLSRLKNALPLPALPPDEEHELAALSQLSDDALWTFAREQMPRDLSEPMENLMDKNSLGTISPEEYTELESLVERGQRLTLRKSEAAAILTRRGYRITPQDLAARE
ncbi:MAG: hypothetical protein ABI690_30930 [Chloroflexota bacterium]